MNDRYLEILHLPHHKSRKHAHMPNSERAAQFSPFAALTGYDLAILEAARVTEQKQLLSQDRVNENNRRLAIIYQNLKSHPEVTIRYFEKDDRKEGGAYLEVTGIIKTMNIELGYLKMEDGLQIAFQNIDSVASPIIEESLD